MIKKILHAALLLMALGAEAQIAIGSAAPHPSAALDLSSTSKGLLIPRMTSAQRNAVTAPALGLQVYDTGTKSIWQYDGTQWIDTALGGIYKGSGSLTGNTIVAAGSNTLAITSSAANAFSVDGATPSFSASTRPLIPLGSR